MNILITGIHGFVGTNLTKALAPKHALYGLDIILPENTHVVETFSWSSIQTNELHEIEAIIHLAGKAHDTKNTTEEQAYYDINVGLTKTIFEKFLASNATTFIYFSSVKAVADSVSGQYVTEDDEPKPGTAYGKSKLEAERYLNDRLGEWEKGRKDRHSERSEESHPILTDPSQAQDDTKKLFILRPAMIHGPGNKGNLNLLYKLVSKGIPWPLGAFENLRSFTSIGNVAFIVQQIIEREIIPGTYNIADDLPISTNRLIELISESKSKKAKIWKMNKKTIQIAATIGGYLHLPLNHERLEKLTESYIVSNQKIKQALGVNQLPINAEEGMIKTLKSFK